MHPTLGPRHPFKALLAVVAMSALVHGLCAHAGPHGDGHVARMQFIGTLPRYEPCDDADAVMLADASDIADEDDDDTGH